MARFTVYLENDSQSRALEAALAREGLSVIVSRRAGMDGTPDPQQLAFAAANGYVLCTANARDFMELHNRYMNEGRRHAGILVRTRQKLSSGEEARRIARIWRTLDDEQMVNRYEFLSQWGEERG